MDTFLVDHYARSFSSTFPNYKTTEPWNVTSKLPQIIEELISTLPDDFTINNNIAVHKSAIIEQGVTLKAPIIISQGCFIGAHAYLRGGVYLGEGSKIGPGCEVKTSILLKNSALAHFNFVGDSIIGDNVNFEAGSIIANHYNERIDKTIKILVNEIEIISTSVKFGAVVGDNSKIGANAVLSPGTVLTKNSVVARLELVDQLKNIR